MRVIDAIFMEMDALMKILDENELENQSFLSCVLPGLMCSMCFLIISGYFIYKNDYLMFPDGIVILFFSGLVGAFFTFPILIYRSTFLSVPSVFRKRSVIFNILVAKVLIYVWGVFAVYAAVAYFTIDDDYDPIVFVATMFFVMKIMVILMVLDLKRFQCLKLRMLIKSFKSSSVKK